MTYDDHFTSFRRTFRLMKFTVLDVLSRLNRDHGARFVEQIISDLLYQSKFSLRFIMYDRALDGRMNMKVSE